MCWGLLRQKVVTDGLRDFSWSRSLDPEMIPSAIGPIPRLVCEVSFAGWFVAVGSELVRKFPRQRENSAMTRPLSQRLRAEVAALGLRKVCVCWHHAWMKVGAVPHRREGIMRSLAFVIALLMGASEATAQERTVFNDSATTGGFGGPVVKVTSVNGQTAWMAGGRGGWVVNHSLIIGGGGYGITSEVNAANSALSDQAPLDLQFGYGGVEVEYRFRPLSLWHVGLYTLVGGGSANYVKDVGSVAESQEHVGQSDAVFVFEPGVNAELNLARWFHINAGVTYRVVSGVTDSALRNRDLSGITGAVTFKFGKF